MGSPTRARGGRTRTQVDTASRLVEVLGGRFSTELGIDVDRGDDEVERWFLAATLFGTRISAAVAGRTFRVLDGAGVRRIADARHVLWDDLVALLDHGGYARYDFRTATRLQDLSEVIDDRYGGRVAEIARRHQGLADLRKALDALPGWGPVTIGLFLRELRGVWPAAASPLDERAASAAGHLGVVASSGAAASLETVEAIARAAALDVRDVESALVRLSLAHHGGWGDCPGGQQCVVLGRVSSERG